MNRVSVIIPTKNRLASLIRCLSAIENNSLKPHEVIVVNDGSVDGTKEFLNTISQKIITIHLPSSLGQSEARNRGIARATGEIVAFTDDDCIPDDMWLEKLLKPFSNPKIDFVIGETLYVSRKHKGHFPERIVQNPGAKWPMSGNIAYRKEQLSAIGMFNKEFDRIGKEDAELGIRAVSRGLKFSRSLDALVFHEKSFWTVKTLLRSARNHSVWPKLKKVYPKHFDSLHPPLIGPFVMPHEYLILLLFPLLFLPLLVIYFVRGNRNIVLFFAKWPVFYIVKRLYIYKESIRQHRLFL